MSVLVAIFVVLLYQFLANFLPVLWTWAGAATYLCVCAGFYKLCGALVPFGLNVLKLGQLTTLVLSAIHTYTNGVVTAIVACPLPPGLRSLICTASRYAPDDMSGFVNSLNVKLSNQYGHIYVRLKHWCYLAYLQLLRMPFKMYWALVLPLTTLLYCEDISAGVAFTWISIVQTAAWKHILSLSSSWQELNLFKHKWPIACGGRYALLMPVFIFPEQGQETNSQSQTGLTSTLGFQLASSSVQPPANIPLPVQYPEGVRQVQYHGSAQDHVPAEGHPPAQGTAVSLPRDFSTLTIEQTGSLYLSRGAGEGLAGGARHRTVPDGDDTMQVDPYMEPHMFIQDHSYAQRVVSIVPDSNQ